LQGIGLIALLRRCWSYQQKLDSSTFEKKEVFVEDAAAYHWVLRLFPQPGHC
jgi:hypothetical protein